MKLISYFDEFLDETVNLNQSRVDDLETSITALQNYVNGSGWAPIIQRWMPQGSWAHKTIIKPIDQGEFDADLIVFVEHVDGWSAADYINTLYKVFAGSDVYKDKVRRWSHCVTITYANDKKIDIAPCIVNRLGYTQLEVCNRDTGTFERTEPVQYTQWLKDQNALSGSHSFRKVTRLIKYLRDIKGTFSCSSVLLTTLLGYRIYASDKDAVTFCDTPTALKTLMTRLDDWLQQHTFVPDVANPFLPTENFADSWTQEKYTIFRDTIHRYREWIDDAYDEVDRDESIEKWQRVFGEAFGKATTSERTTVSKQDAMANLRRRVMNAVSFPFDVVAAVRRGGIAALPLGFGSQPHMQDPEWKYAAAGIGEVHIKAELHFSKTGNKIRDVASSEVNQPEHWLRFSALNRNGLPFNASEYDVQWRITNTDRTAFELGGVEAMRGGFYSAHGNNMRWEQLKYHGVHITEAFVILKRTQEIVAQSKPFYVAID